MLFSVALADPTCGDDTIADTHTLLQVQQSVRGKKGQPARQTPDNNEASLTAATLLSKVRNMAVTLKQNQENAEGGTNTSLDVTTSALEDLVKNMVEAMETEHTAASRLNNDSWSEVVRVTNSSGAHHNIRYLQALNLTKFNASKQCMMDFANWTAEKAEACPAWRTHAQSLATCSQAHSCALDANAFYEAFTIWRI